MDKVCLSVSQWRTNDMELLDDPVHPIRGAVLALKGFGVSGGGLFVLIYREVESVARDKLVEGQSAVFVKINKGELALCTLAAGVGVDGAVPLSKFVQ